MLYLRNMQLFPVELRIVMGIHVRKRWSVLLLITSKPYRTDELGDIQAISDGKSISFSQEGVIPETEAEHMQYVYITDSGKTYHKEDCSSLAKSKHRITLQEAKEKGYTACKRCFAN